MRKKILLVITKSIWGGAQRYVYDLATRLPAEKFEAAVVCGGRGALVDQLGPAGIRVIPIPHLERDVNVQKELLALFSLLRIFIREKPDIIHLSSSKVGGLGAAAARLASLLISRRSLVIFTVHGWPFGENRPLPERILIFISSWLSTILVKRVIVINSADYRTARWFVPDDKLKLIGHGLGPIDFLPRRDSRQELGKLIASPILEKTRFVGTITELTRNKGLTYLIDAIAHLKSNVQHSMLNLNFIVIGDGEERERLSRRINNLGLSGTVHLLGFVPGASRYLKGLDIFVLPSVKEGLPYAIMEAMAAGLPVIASRVGGIPDLITDGKTGRLVPPRKAEALAAAVKEALAAPEQYRAMGERAEKLIRADFQLERMMRATITAYSLN